MTKELSGLKEAVSTEGVDRTYNSGDYGTGRKSSGKLYCTPPRRDKEEGGNLDGGDGGDSGMYGKVSFEEVEGVPSGVVRGVDVLRAEVERWREVAEEKGQALEECRRELQGGTNKLSWLSSEVERLKRSEEELLKKWNGDKVAWEERLNEEKKNKVEVTERLRRNEELVGELEGRLAKVDGRERVLELEDKLRKAEKLFKSMQAKFQKHLNRLEAEKQQQLGVMKEECVRRVGEIEGDKGRCDEKIRGLRAEVEELRRLLVLYEEEKREVEGRVEQEREQQKQDYRTSIEQVRTFYERRASQLRQEVVSSVHREAVDKRVARERHKTAKFLRRYYLDTLRSFLNQHQHNLGHRFISAFVVAVEAALDDATPPSTPSISPSIPPFFTPSLQASPRTHPQGNSRTPEKSSTSEAPLKLVDEDKKCDTKYPFLSPSVPSSHSLHALQPTNSAAFRPPPISLHNQRHHLIMQSFEDINKLCSQSTQLTAQPSSKLHSTFDKNSRSDFHFSSLKTASSLRNFAPATIKNNEQTVDEYQSFKTEQQLKHKKQHQPQQQPQLQHQPQQQPQLQHQPQQQPQPQQQGNQLTQSQFNNILVSIDFSFNFKILQLRYRIVFIQLCKTFSLA